MNRSLLGLALVIVIALAVLNLPSCGHERKLVSITVNPPAFTFLTPDSNLQVQYTALGTYIHPPDTRDITTQATWKVDFAQLVTMDKGLVSPSGDHCGVANVAASFDDGGNLVIGYATVTVNDPTNVNCPGGGTEGAVSVTLAGTQAGTVVSVPGGINCPAQSCVAAFAVGSTVGLTATPDPNHSFVNWTGCTSNTGNSCSVTVPTGGVNVSATFN